METCAHRRVRWKQVFTFFKKEMPFKFSKRKFANRFFHSNSNSEPNSLFSLIMLHNYVSLTLTRTPHYFSSLSKGKHNYIYFRNRYLSVAVDKLQNRIPESMEHFEFSVQCWVCHMAWCFAHYQHKCFVLGLHLTNTAQ